MALTIVMVDYGYGKTKALLQPSQMTQALKYSNFAVLVNGFAMAFLKISIGLSLLRLQLGKGMVWIVWGSIFLSVVVNGLVVVTTLFGCRPLAAAWDRSLMPVATCLPRTVTVAHSYTQTGLWRSLTYQLVSIVTDIPCSGQHRHGLVLQPQPALLSLQCQGFGLQQMGSPRRVHDRPTRHRLRHRQMHRAAPLRHDHQPNL